jgi:hypothetical protein
MLVPKLKLNVGGKIIVPDAVCTVPIVQVKVDAS